MNKRFSQDSFLPIIQQSPTQKTSKAQTIHERYSSQLNIIKFQQSNQITKLLREVRHSMKSNLDDQKSLKKQRQRKEQRKRRKQNFLNKKQKKIYYFQTTPTNENQILIPKQTMKRLSSLIPHSVQVQQIQSLQKPPHRSKTSMCIENDKMYIYGGIGCEPNLKLAIFDIQNKKWSFPVDEKFAQYHPTTPITGHSFACYKGKGFIYGGKSTDTINELSIVNFKDYKFTQGQRCQYRRKDHAMIMISKFMIIHGGIQTNQVANSMYFYNTQTNTWGYPIVSSSLPFLSHHSMACTFPLKTKKKQLNSLSELLDPIFIFGGKDKKGNLLNNLYKVIVQNDSLISTKIDFFGSIWPQKRMQMAFHHVGNNYIILYGGKMTNDQQYGDIEINNSPVFTLNTQKLQWSQLLTSQALPDRYGMASATSNGKVYLFGGFINNKYANANVTTLATWNPDMMKSKTNFGTRTVLSKQTLY